MTRGGAEPLHAAMVVVHNLHGFTHSFDSRSLEWHFEVALDQLMLYLLLLTRTIHSTL